MASSTQIPKTKLQDGNEIPALGFGTGTAWYKPDRFSAANPEMVSMILDAVKAGYRHLDSAEAYGTEAELGEAVRRSGVPREEFFVTTKVVNTINEGGPGDVTVALENSLKRMGLDYLDLYILHSPYTDSKGYDEADVAKAWSLMEDAQRAGKVRSIGVSNFRRHHVENLLKTAAVPPAVNQIQLNPYVGGAAEYVKWLAGKGIATQSYMGLAPITHLAGKGGGNLDEVLGRLAGKYGVSRATVLIRWQLDLGVVVLNTTKKADRLGEFLAALGLELEEGEREEVGGGGGGEHVRTPLPFLFDGGERGPYEY